MRANKKSPAKPEKKPASRSLKRGAVGYSKKTALLEEAITHMNAGKYGRSSAALKELLGLDPHNMEARRLFATLHLRLGSLIPARQAFDALITEALERQDYWLAESLLQEYLSAGPRCVPFLEKLGAVYQEKGDVLEAAAEYGKAIDLLIEDPDPENAERAAQLYGKIRELAPASAVAFRLASLFNAQTGALIPGQKPVDSEEPAVAEAVREDRLNDTTPWDPSTGSMPWEQPEDPLAEPLLDSPGDAPTVPDPGTDDSRFMPGPDGPRNFLGGTLADPGEGRAANESYSLIRSGEELPINDAAQQCSAEANSDPLVSESPIANVEHSDDGLLVPSACGEGTADSSTEVETVTVIPGHIPVLSPQWFQPPEHSQLPAQEQPVVEWISVPMPVEEKQTSSVQLSDPPFEAGGMWQSSPDSEGCTVETLQQDVITPDSAFMPCETGEAVVSDTLDRVMEAPLLSDASREPAFLWAQRREQGETNPCFSVATSEEKHQLPAEEPDSLVSSPLSDIQAGDRLAFMDGGESESALEPSRDRLSSQAGNTEKAPPGEESVPQNAPLQDGAPVDSLSEEPQSGLSWEAIFGRAWIFGGRATKSGDLPEERAERLPPTGAPMSEPGLTDPSIEPEQPSAVGSEIFALPPFGQDQEPASGMEGEVADDSVARVSAPSEFEFVESSLTAHVTLGGPDQEATVPVGPIAGSETASIPLVELPAAACPVEPEFRLLPADPIFTEKEAGQVSQAEPDHSAATAPWESKRLGTETPEVCALSELEAVAEWHSTTPVPDEPSTTEECAEAGKVAEERGALTAAELSSETLTSQVGEEFLKVAPIQQAEACPPSGECSPVDPLWEPVGPNASFSPMSEGHSHDEVAAANVAKPDSPAPEPVATTWSTSVPPAITEDPSSWREGVAAAELPVEEATDSGGGELSPVMSPHEEALSAPWLSEESASLDSPMEVPPHEPVLEPVTERASPSRTGKFRSFLAPPDKGDAHFPGVASEDQSSAHLVPSHVAPLAVDVLFESTGRMTTAGSSDRVDEPRPRRRWRARLARSRIAATIFIASCFSTTQVLVLTSVALVFFVSALTVLGLGAVGLTWMVLDESPSPAFQHLTTNPPRNLAGWKQNGYWLLLGFEAPAGQDPIQAGYHRKPSDHEKHMVTACPSGRNGGRDPAQTSASARVSSGLFRSRDPVGQFQANKSTIREWATGSGEAALARYAQWLKLSLEDWGYGQSVDLPCSSILFAHQVYIAEGFVQGAETGLDRLVADMEAWRRTLGEARTLAMKTLALQAVADDAAVASGLLSQPKFDGKTLAPITTIVRPLDPVERSLRWPMQSELVRASKSYDEQLAAARGKDLALYAAIAARLPLPQQRRLNRYAEYYEASSQVDGVGEYNSLPKWNQYIHVPAGGVLDYFASPIENLIGLQPLPRWDRYAGLMMDLDARLRLVSLQAWLRLGGPGADLLARIAKAGQRLYDPYTGFPMLVSQKKGVMYSIGHDGRDQDADPETDIVVAIPVSQTPEASEE